MYRLILEGEFPTTKEWNRRKSKGTRQGKGFKNRKVNDSLGYVETSLQGRATARGGGGYRGFARTWLAGV